MTKDNAKHELSVMNYAKSVVMKGVMTDIFGTFALQAVMKLNQSRMLRDIGLGVEGSCVDGSCACLFRLVLSCVYSS